MNNKNYKTSRRYKCPYCDLKASRNDLVLHIDRKHESLIPENYTSARVIFDYVNGKDHGICMICKQPVYEWNDKIDRYYNICNNPACRSKVRENALKNHIKVYNTPTLLNDANHQEKMLANRKISGTYTFSDGGKATYTGSYEKSALEFMDHVLNIPSTDIQAPGPIIEYHYEGEVHKWITDIFYIPANLIIEVKDGGSNPNNRSMVSYRNKQKSKEDEIIKLGTYNYLRLTNNNFAQLLSIFADMKNEALENDKNPKMKIHINEEVGGLPPHRPPSAYIVPYGMNDVFDGFAYSDDTIDKFITISDYGTIEPLIEESLYAKYQCAPMLVYDNDDSLNKILKIHEAIAKNNISNSFYFIEELSGIKMNKLEDLFITECFKYYDKNDKSISKLIANAIYMQLDESTIDSNRIKTIGNVAICHSPSGYYAATVGDFYIASDYFSDIESLERSGVINIMNDIYNAKQKSIGGSKNE